MVFHLDHFDTHETMPRSRANLQVRLIKFHSQLVYNIYVVAQNKEGKKAFLDLLMELTHEGTKFTDEELREEVDTMMIAVSNSSATYAQIWKQIRSIIIMQK